MKIPNLIVVLIFLCSFGCSLENGNNAESSPTEEPKEQKKVYSQITKDKTLALIESASVITSGTESGMSFMSYAKAVEKYNSDLDMLMNFLPDDFNLDRKGFLLSAKQSWVLTRQLWAKKIDMGAESFHVVYNWPPSDSPELFVAALIKDDDGRPYYDSIGTTLGVGGLYFALAKPSLLKILK